MRHRSSHGTAYISTCTSPCCETIVGTSIPCREPDPKQSPNGIWKADPRCSYWDWTLDWEDLTGAPVWDETLGFGGDGNMSNPGPYPVTVQNSKQSYCVTTGPFKDVQVFYGTSPASAHCLSRGFYHYENQEPGKISGLHVRPEVIEELESVAHYDEYRNRTEFMVHNGIHWGIGGDFERWSSANGKIYLSYITSVTCALLKYRSLLHAR